VCEPDFSLDFKPGCRYNEDAWFETPTERTAMKRIICVLAVFGLVSVAAAQDGIYGSFLVGYKYINMQPLNDVIT